MGGGISPSYREELRGNSTYFDLSPLSGFEIDQITGCTGRREGSRFITDAIFNNCNVTVSYKQIVIPIPSNVTSQLNGYDINVSWSQVSQANSYKVRQRVNGGTWQSPINVGNILNYPFNSLQLGATYEYQVSACNGSNCSYWSATTTDITIPDTPAIPAKPGATVQGKNITVTWSKVAQASSYEISQRKDSGSWGAGFRVGDVNQETFTDLNPGSTYEYKVAACHGNCSAWSLPSNPIAIPDDSVLTPTFFPGTEYHKGIIEVTLNSATSGAIVRYTLDGSPVTLASPQYSSSFKLTKTTTINAKAFKDGLTPSSPISKTYTIQGYSVQATSDEGGAINPSEVEVEHGKTADFDVVAEPGYRLDEVNGCSGLLISENVFQTAPVMDDCSVNARFILADVVSAPFILPDGGTFNGSVTVKIESQTEDTAIFYTLDNTEVSESSTLYEEPLVFTESTVLRVKAYKEGMTESEEVQAEFIVTPMDAPWAELGGEPNDFALNQPSIDQSNFFGATLTFSPDLTP
ncbi:hypothetical protein GCM10027098_42130 [Bowmanella dokdonensis]